MTEQTTISPALAASQASWRCVQARDKEGWLSLMADDIVIEDPIGKAITNPDGNGIRGKAAVEEFFDKNIATNNLRVECEETFPSSSELEVAHILTLHSAFEGGLKSHVRGVFTYTLNEDHLITNLRGWWNMEAMVFEQGKLNLLRKTIASGVRWTASWRTSRYRLRRSSSRARPTPPRRTGWPSTCSRARAPEEALEVLEPALEQDRANTGLRMLRAWAYLIRVQLGPAEDRAPGAGRGAPGRRLAAVRARSGAGAPVQVRRSAAAPAAGRRDVRRTPSTSSRCFGWNGCRERSRGGSGSRRRSR